MTHHPRLALVAAWWVLGAAVWAFAPVPAVALDVPSSNRSVAELTTVSPTSLGARTVWTAERLGRRLDASEPFGPPAPAVLAAALWLAAVLVVVLASVTHLRIGRPAAPGLVHPRGPPGPPVRSD